MAPWWIKWIRSRLTFSIPDSSAGYEAARDAGDVLLPLRTEGEHQNVPHESLVLSEAQHLAASLVRDLLEAVAQGPVELGKGRDDLGVLAIEPAVGEPFVLLV